MTLTFSPGEEMPHAPGPPRAEASSARIERRSSEPGSLHPGSAPGGRLLTGAPRSPQRAHTQDGKASLSGEEEGA